MYSRLEGLDLFNVDSFRLLTSQLHTNLVESLRAVTEIEKCNISEGLHLIRQQTLARLWMTVMGWVLVLLAFPFAFLNVTWPYLVPIFGRQFLCESPTGSCIPHWYAPQIGLGLIILGLFVARIYPAIADSKKRKRAAT